MKRSANDNYQASLAPGGQSFKRSENDNYRASLAPRRNSSGNSNNAPLGSVENRGQKRSLGSGKLLNFTYFFLNDLFKDYSKWQKKTSFKITCSKL